MPLTVRSVSVVSRIDGFLIGYKELFLGGAVWCIKSIEYKEKEIFYVSFFRFDDVSDNSTYYCWIKFIQYGNNRWNITKYW